MSQISPLTAAVLIKPNVVYKNMYIQIISKVTFFKSLYRHFMYIRGLIDYSRATRVLS